MTEDGVWAQSPASFPRGEAGEHGVCGGQKLTTGRAAVRPLARVPDSVLYQLPLHVKRLPVTKTFHEAGLVVSVEENDAGYGELPETDASFKGICKTIVEAPSNEERLKALALIQEMMQPQRARDNSSVSPSILQKPSKV